jgi:hypothetical protein
MKPGPRLACRVLLENIDILDPPRDAVDHLTLIIEDKAWIGNAASARERAEGWADAFLRYLRQELDALNRLGRYSPFAFNSSADYKVQGAAFVEPADSGNLQEQKRRRARFGEYVTALRALTPRQFECLCAGLLSVLNVEDLNVTAYSKDRGVDFYCRLPLERHIFGNDLYPSWKRQLRIWMVGQAKHYVDNVVSTPEIAKLVGSVKLLSGSTADRSHFPKLIVRSCDPVFLLFFTTGRLSSESWNLLDESGVVGMDGEMLAAFLADREIGCSTVGFEMTVFETWIASFERKN